jgi:hypothetical protein
MTQKGRGENMEDLSKESKMELITLGEKYVEEVKELAREEDIDEIIALNFVLSFMIDYIKISKK